MNCTFQVTPTADGKYLHRCTNPGCGREKVIAQTKWIAPCKSAAKRDPIKNPCLHRGDETGELLTCPTCQGNIQVKVFACAEFGECTLAKGVEKPEREGTLPVCQTCNRYQAKTV